MSGRGAPKGNTNAAKAKHWRQALKLALTRAGGDIQRGLAPIADVVVSAAQRGDMQAIVELANRLDGKPAQAIDISGDMVVRDANELSDAQLAAIAAGSSAGASDAEGGASKPAEFH